MPYWKILGLLSLMTALTACDNNARSELLCTAEYQYNTSGADAAIAVVRQIGDEHDYVVGNNVARFLILRGADTGNVDDFDEANAVLSAMKPASADDPELIISRYISVLRFLAIANGSDRNGARQELTQYCRESTQPEAECLRNTMTEIFEHIALSDGTKNNSYKDLSNLFNETYRSEFNDPSLDVLRDYSRSVVTSCGTNE